MYRKFNKHIIDFIFSLLGLLFLFPVLLLVSIILIITNHGKPFFLQQRPGLQGRIFRVVKFKTMNDKRDKAGNLLPDEYRLTTIGKFIRKTSLDEIPQLINVLKGDMSLVGPRPLLVEYLPLYNEFQKRRHEVRPGITGWAQVNGRNTISWEKKFEYDVWYVNDLSFWLDMKILCLTVFKVLKSEGINQTGQTTTELFKGNKL